MKGMRTHCYVCGRPGYVYGVPGWYDRCSDESACADRAASQRDRLAKENAELKKQLEAKKTSETSVYPTSTD